MGKHVNTKVKCFSCSKDFMTTRLKIDFEEYFCPNCGQKHQAEENEVYGGWIHTVVEGDNNEGNL